MDKNKLIARRIVQYYPYTIAKKNWYKDKNHKTFKGNATRDKYLDKKDEKIAHESEKFLKTHPFAFIVACQLDMGKKSWKAWRGPFLIASIIGKRNFRPEAIMSLHLNTLTSIIKREKLGCRNLPASRAALNIKLLSKLIVEKYDSKAQNIWESPNSFDELKSNLDELPGFGVKLVNMTCKILLGLGMLPQIKKSKINISKLQVAPDIHVKRIFYRTGLSMTMTNSAVFIAAAKYLPNIPMALDSAFFISQDFCYKSIPYCNKCPLSKSSNGKQLCIRRGLD